MPEPGEPLSRIGGTVPRAKSRKQGGNSDPPVVPIRPETGSVCAPCVRKAPPSLPMGGAVRRPAPFGKDSLPVLIVDPGAETETEPSALSSTGVDPSGVPEAEATSVPPSDEAFPAGIPGLAEAEAFPVRAVGDSWEGPAEAFPAGTDARAAEVAGNGRFPNLEGGGLGREGGGLMG